MAVFQTIRNRLGPIIVIIIGLSLAVFVLETALNSNTNLLRGDQSVVGIIDGEKIDIRDYQVRVDETINNYKLQNNQANPDENTLFSIRDQTWNQMVNDRLNSEEYNRLGVAVSTQELKDMFFGPDPIPEIKQAFTNPETGTFDPIAVKNYYERLDEQGPNEQPGERRQRWVSFEKAQKDLRLSTKYSDMVKNALYVPKWLAEVDYNEKNTRSNLSFVSVPYTTLNDSTIKPTDAELQEYLNTHKEQFKQEESRKIEYVLFTVSPSAEDTAAAVKEINELHQKIVASPDDTDFIKLNSDKGLDKFYYKKENIESALVADSLFKVPVGTVVGPYFEDGAYKVVKLMDRRDVADSVRAHHIHLRVEVPSDSLKAKTRIDSFYNAIINGTPFDSLAKKYSDDKGSGEKGGDLGYMAQGRTVKNFNNFLFFEGKPGDLEIVHTEFGYHIVRIDSAKNIAPAVQINFVSRPLEASGETDKIMFEKATRFASENNSMDKFIKASEDQKLNKMMAPSVLKNGYQVPGLMSAREMVKWAYSAELGDVSSPFAIQEHYVVATVSGIKAEGTSSVDDVRSQLEMFVLKEKKAEQIASEIAASMALNTTLEALASKLGQPVKTAGNVVFANAYAENLGYEPKVIGTVFSLKENQLSKPISGEQGVYIVQIQSITKPQPIADYNQFKQQLLQSLQPRLQYGLVEALKKSVKIEDNRYLFF